MYGDLMAGMPPYAQVKQNLAVWSQTRWHYYNIDYIETLPASSQTSVNIGAPGANATIAQLQITAFDVDEHQLIQLRFMPIDDVELILWLTRGQGKFNTRGVQTRVTKMTRGIDPYYASSEFNILGRDRDAFIEVRNLGDYALAQARVLFWGRKYILVPLRNIEERVDDTGILRPVLKTNGMPMVFTYVNAEGRMA